MFKSLDLSFFELYTTGVNELSSLGLARVARGRSSGLASRQGCGG